MGKQTFWQKLIGRKPLTEETSTEAQQLRQIIQQQEINLQTKDAQLEQVTTKYAELEKKLQAQTHTSRREEELEQQLLNKTRELNMQVAETNTLQQELASMTDALARSNEQLMSNAHTATLENQIETYRKQVNEHEVLIVQLQQQLTQKEDIALQQQTKRTELQIQLTKVTSELKQKEEQLLKLRQQLMKFSADDTRLAQLQDRITKLTTERDEARYNYSKIESQLKRVKEDVDVLEELYKKNKQQIADEQHKYEQLRNTLSKENAELKAKLKEYEQIIGQASESAGKIARYRRLMVEYNDKITLLTKQVTAQQLTIEQLQAQQHAEHIDIQEEATHSIDKSFSEVAENDTSELEVIEVNATGEQQQSELEVAETKETDELHEASEPVEETDVTASNDVQLLQHATPPADEQYVPASQQEVEKLIVSVIDESFEQELALEQRASAFAVRNDLRYEDEQMGEAVRYAKSEYDSLMPPGGRFAIREREEIDYATAYVNAILDERKEQRRSILLQFMRQPYFARMDVLSERGYAQTLYISEHMANVRSDIISWQSPVASLFYSKMVGIRQKHGTLGNVKVDYIQQFSVSDGHVNDLYEPIMSDDAAYVDEQLMQTLQANDGQSMKTIVASIQKEQYDIISLPISEPLIIQGSAGSGKSVIALHRLSYLLYQYKQLMGDKVAMVAPNETFLQYIQLVLPALGNFNVQQLTLPMILQQQMSVQIVAETHPTDIVAMKGSLAFSEQIERLTYDKINALDTWVTPLRLAQMELSMVPIVQQMDAYKELMNKDRLNLYYNFFVKQYRQQLAARIAHTEQLQQLLNDTLMQHIALPKERIPQQQVEAYIEETLRTLPALPNSFYEPLLQLEWQYEVEQQCIVAQNALLQQHVQTARYTTYAATQFDKLWEQHESTIRTQLQAKKEAFYNERREQLRAYATNNYAYYVEQQLLVQYHVRKKPTYTHMPLPTDEETDEHVQRIKQWVAQRIETDAKRMYVSFAKEASLQRAIGASLTKSDIAPLLHIHRLLNGVDEQASFKYMIVDEAQDYMPYEVQELYARTVKNGMMLIGDLGQNINRANTLQQWSDYNELLHNPTVFELSATYRSTKQIVAFCNAIIEPYAKQRYTLPAVAYRDGEEVNVVTYRQADVEATLIKELERLFERHDVKQVVLIVKHTKQLQTYQYIIDPYYSNAIQTDSMLAGDVKVVLTTVKDAKGLEFEHVILLDFDMYEATDDDRKLAYVAASRALHTLTIFTSAKQTALLN